MKPFSMVSMILVLAMTGTAHAQGSKVSSAPELARPIEALKPGQWVWAPAIAPSGPVMIYLQSQRLKKALFHFVFETGLQIQSRFVYFVAAFDRLKFHIEFDVWFDLG